MVKIKKIEVKRLNNKSRKGTYYRGYYVDNQGISRETTLKYQEGMTFEDIKEHMNMLSETEKGTAEARKINIKTKNKIRLKVKKTKIQSESKSEKSYYLKEKETSWNRLVVDREHEQSIQKYVSGETRIIMALKSEHGSLRNMSESEFRMTLEDYIGVPDSRNKRLFINDIVNKWGVEFKK